ncbi:ankyrin repeat protein [Acanthamoeba polyphaga moumouvirus]|uniref:Ankyrin repeat protein n=1 Tax=Acanthamoeba polyphaga moumouvirus TaxID=1269028 RepID=L7RCP6_9VIRU|nr:ankyrin repeat protein [Acanthamoeba polyphaga moumouvirus]AGC02389.1 ankyrin repeat protein [Acanthamoeba polyphaga moumouvirus]
MNSFKNEYYLPVELWKYILDQDISKTFGLLFTSKDFFAMIPLLSCKFYLLNYFIKKDSKIFIEYYLQCEKINGEKCSLNHKKKYIKHDKYLTECLKMSCIYGYLNVLDYCVKNGADYRFNNDEPVKLALEHGHLNIAEYLYKKKVNIRANQNISLITACQKGNYEVVKFLLDRKVSPISKNNDSFVAACQNGHLNIVKLLMEKNVDINTGKILPIVASIRGNHRDIFKYLIDKGVEINNYSVMDNLLHWDCLEMIKYAIDINDTDIDFITNILKYSAGFNNIEIVKYLCDKNNFDNNQTFEAFKSATSNNCLEIIKYFLDKYEFSNDQKFDLFITASANNHIDVVKYLFSSGIVFIKHLYTNDFLFCKHLFNYDIVTKCPRIKFHWIINYSNKEIIEFYLENRIFEIDELYEEIIKSTPKNIIIYDYLIKRNNYLHGFILDD